MKILKLLLIGIFIQASAMAQVGGGEKPAKEDDFIGDFTYTRYSIRERKPVPYPAQREADVMYARRVVRILDTKEKQNLICRWPKNPLSKIIFEAAENGEVAAFKDDSLLSFWRPDTVITMLSSKEVIQVPDREFIGDFKDSTVINKFQYEDEVVKYEIIEDWIFDKQRGIFYPRIIAMGPRYKLMEGSLVIAEYAPFYCSWDELRKLLIGEEIFNRHNDAAKFSYYDWFELRLFSSYIIKEPNVFDLKFNEYDELKDNPLAQLLESERVKDELFNWEHDLWQY